MILKEKLLCHFKSNISLKITSKMLSRVIQFENNEVRNIMKTENSQTINEEFSVIVFFC